MRNEANSQTTITRTFNVLTNGAKYKVDWLHGKIESPDARPHPWHFFLLCLLLFRVAICCRQSRRFRDYSISLRTCSTLLVILHRIKRLWWAISLPFLQQWSQFSNIPPQRVFYFRIRHPRGASNHDNECEVNWKSFYIVSRRQIATYAKLRHSRE